MLRKTAWVLALLITCAPGFGAAESRDQQGGAQRAASPPGSPGPEGKHKEPIANRPPEDRERWKWWLYDRAELGIADQQSAAINQIFESTIPKLRESRKELDDAEEQLSRTIKEHKADLAVVSHQIDRVEGARSQYNKLRVLMLYRMHLLLTPEQRGKLEALRARQDAARGGKQQPPPGGRR